MSRDDIPVVEDLRSARLHHQQLRGTYGVVGLLVGGVLLWLSEVTPSVIDKACEALGGAVLVASVTALGAFALHRASKVEQRELAVLERMVRLSPGAEPSAPATPAGPAGGPVSP